MVEAGALLARLETGKAARIEAGTLSLFEAAPAPPPEPSALESALAEIDPDALTPREALEALYRLKALLG